MFTKKMVLFLFMGLALPLFAEETNGALQGEIFIVTQGADNIRLGLVEIKVFTEIDMTNYIANRLKQAPSEMPNYDEQARIAEEGIQGIKTNIEDIKTTITNYSGKVDEDAIKNGRKGVKLAEGIVATFEEIKRNILDRKKNWPDAEYLVKDLPEPKYSTLTDADGKFKLALPCVGKFALVAQASRQISEKSKENYYWLIWVSLDGQSIKEILLSNHNQVTSNAKESVISTKY